MLTIEELRESKYVLPADVVLSPVEALPATMRRLLETQPKDYALTRRYARGGTKILSQATAILLEEFRAPNTLLDAIMAFSKQIGQDPVAVLDSAGQIVLDMVDQDCLTREGSDQAARTVPSLSNGDRFQGLEILRCCQLLEDTEVYQAKDDADKFYAVKMLRKGEVSDFMFEMFEREQRVLEAIGGGVAPKLIDKGLHDGRPFIVMEWIDGVSLGQAIFLYHREAIRMGSVAEMQALLLARLVIAERVAGAYAELHRKGVVHGDVHPRNIIVASDGTIRVIDFGFGRILSETDRRVPRAGVPTYYDPEFALFGLEGGYMPEITSVSEQYSVAAVVYETLSSEMVAEGRYLPLTFVPSEELRQIVEDEPLPLTSYFGIMEPKAEKAILKALSKRPEDRHDSMEGFHALLIEASDDVRAKMDETAPKAIRGTGLLLSESRAYVKRFVSHADVDGPWTKTAFKHSPSCSIKYGAAGIAYSLYKLACHYEDPLLLENADLWITRALAHQKDRDAFYSRSIEIHHDSVGKVTPYHTPSGLYLVQAMIADAMGNANACQEALEQYVVWADNDECKNLDLTLGKTAVLLGAAILHDRFKNNPYLDLSSIRDLGDRIEHLLWERVPKTPIASKEGDYLGMAHGWSGFCYGSMRWWSTTGAAPKEHVRSRIEELVELAEDNGKGVQWPYAIGNKGYAGGWCNGHAGWLFFWIEAARTYGDPRYAKLAEASGLSVWGDRHGISSICCGAAGKAYSLLDLYRYTEDKIWLRRAERITRLAIENEEDGYSLYKSMAGVAVLAAEIEAPDGACMPVFERECPLGRG